MGRHYDSAEYKRFRQWIRDQVWLPCHWCGRARATSPDHDPPLSAFANRAEWEGELVPSCLRCNIGRGGAARQASRRAGSTVRRRQAGRATLR